ncbi:putative tRNA N6-adenosine threonylcarbamoyltransferase, mitochondrial [Collichthys lucidus]|uniref:N(6)-L-threonylcarbamoyladenine synthase n=1 Tax=Collichthys lucidus TaxID=240159 RepID=A0A4U5U2F7_COLLU|nr:putative tRNA N6-adenosine threonylcarbamoyltransferase, mitochondrial [Collichthys lucidus]
MFHTKANILRRLPQVCFPASFGKAHSSRLVLGIETSCDDTGAAVLDETGQILGESLHSQKEVHLRTGGIIPTVAQQLHRENIERVVHEALQRSNVDAGQLSAVATTVKPGLALSLGIGLEFSQRFVRKHNKPFIPIHHMEAHALTVRMLQPVAFPFLVLLVSGGHSLLAVARGVDDFLLLGHTLDEAPGDTLDKVLSGGVASNQYIRKTLSIVTETTGLHLLCPPAKFCTDNGVMIAWNGVERLREGKGILPPDVDVFYEPKAPLGADITAEVEAAAIKLPSVRMKILN